MKPDILTALEDASKLLDESVHNHNMVVRWDNGDLEGFSGSAFSSAKKAKESAENKAFRKSKFIKKNYTVLGAKEFAQLSSTEKKRLKRDWDLSGRMDESKELEESKLKGKSSLELAQMIFNKEISWNELEKAVGEDNPMLDRIGDMVSNMEVGKDPDVGDVDEVDESTELSEATEFEAVVFNRWIKPEIYKAKRFPSRKDVASFLKEYPNSVAQVHKRSTRKEKLSLGFPAFHAGRVTTGEETEYYVNGKKVDYSVWAKHIKDMDSKSEEGNKTESIEMNSKDVMKHDKEIAKELATVLSVFLFQIEKITGQEFDNANQAEDFIFAAYRMLRTRESGTLKAVLRKFDRIGGERMANLFRRELVKDLR